MKIFPEFALNCYPSKINIIRKLYKLTNSNEEMASLIKVTDEVLGTLNPAGYTHRIGLESPVKQIADLDKTSWIKIPYELTNGKYSLIFDPARLSNNSTVEKVGKELGINCKNTSKDFLGREFIGSINLYEALKLNLSLGNKTPNMNEFRNILKILYQGANEQIKVYNNAGKKLNSNYLEKVFNDIVKVQSPRRGEWLDANFEIKDGKLYINYNHFLDPSGPNGISSGVNLIPKNSEPLDSNTLMRDKTPGISFKNWLINSTKQGLPTKNFKKGNLYYWYPRNEHNSVARFGVDSDGIDFNCYGGPFSGGPNLGARSIREKIN